jgi:hypothetical protein
LKNYLFRIVIILCSATFANAGNLRVASEGVREFPHVLPGKKIHIQKTYNPETGEVRLISTFPELNTPEDMVALENEEWRLLKKKYGSLNESLRNKYDSMKDSDTIQVAISSRFPPGITYFNKYDHTDLELEEQSKQIEQIQPLKDVATILSNHDVKRIRRYDAAYAVATLSKRQLSALMKDENVGGISPEISIQTSSYTQANFLPIFFAQIPTPVSSLAASAYNHSQLAPPPNSGSSFSVGTFEVGITQPFLTCANLTPAVWEPFSSGDLTHSQLTFRVLTYAVDNVSYHHRNSFRFNDPASQSFIINNRLRMLSSSTYRSGLISPGVLHPLTATDDEFLIMDDFVYRPPFPLFSNPTGNQGHQYESHWQGYNGISVGNVRHSNYTHFEIGEHGGATMTRNPKERYGGSCVRGTNDPPGVYSYCSSDREMPSIVAPGWSPTRFLNPDGSGSGAYMTDPCIPGNFTWGSSFSTPTLSGMAARVLGGDLINMANYPEKIKARRWD